MKELTTEEIKDIEYLKKNLYASLKVPVEEFFPGEGMYKWLLATGLCTWLAPDGSLTDSCYTALQLNSEAEAIRVNMVHDNKYTVEEHLFY